MTVFAPDGCSHSTTKARCHSLSPPRLPWSPLLPLLPLLQNLCPFPKDKKVLTLHIIEKEISPRITLPFLSLYTQRKRQIKSAFIRLYPSAKNSLQDVQSTTVDRRRKKNKPPFLKGAFMASDAPRMLNGKVAVSGRVPMASVSFLRALCQVDDGKEQDTPVVAVR